MITQENDIKRFFEALGMLITIYKPGKNYRHWHIVEFHPGGTITLDRFQPLVSYYFPAVRSLDFDRLCVKLSDFNSDGHGYTGVCKKCGCTNDNACVETSGRTCFWITDDLCSACATKEQVDAIMDKFRSDMNEEGGDTV